MKKLLLTVLFGMFAVAGFSQLRWDAKFGMNFSNLTVDGTKALPGFTMGVGMDYEFNENWALQPGVMFTSKGYKVKDVYKARPVYLDIPILAAYKFAVTDNAKLFINAGPYLAFGLGGKVKFDGGGDMKVFDKDEGDADRFDIGLQWGIGAELNGHYIVSITGQHGFISPFDEGKNMSFAIGVGYRF